MTEITNTPQAPEMEEAVVGAIISGGNGIFERVSEILQPVMFFDPDHQELYKILAGIHATGSEINIVSTVQNIRDANKIDRITVMDLHNYTRNSVPDHEIERYCHVVAEKHAARHALRRVQEIQAAITTGMPIDYILEEIARLDGEINEVFTGGETGLDAIALLRLTMEAQEKKIVNYRKGEVSGLPTGFYKLDRKIGGFAPGTFTIVAGRPGGGKTSLGLHFAEVAANHGAAVIFFSFEMTAVQIGEILISRSSGIDRTDLRDGRTDDDQLQTINQTISRITKNKIHVFDNPNMTTVQIEAQARRLVKRYDRAIVIVDYLQLIPPEDKKITREQQVSAISRHLKKISMALKIPVICMAQLNREAKDGEPQLYHLRESGAIEQDADAVILLWQPTAESVEDPTATPSGLIKLKIAKNRHGEPGLLNVYHNCQFTAFSEDEFSEKRQAPAARIDQAPPPPVTTNPLFTNQKLPF